MKIARVSYRAAPRYGVVEGDRLRLLSEPPFEQIKTTNDVVPMREVKLLPPTECMNYWGVGFNYPSHVHQAAETSGQHIPKLPRPWLKGVGSLIGSEDPIIIPPEAGAVHYEGELVVVVKRKCRRVSPEEARDCILGYTCGNDVSEKKEWEREHTFWRAKGTDTFGPAGPWIETELEPEKETLTVRLNGKVVDTTSISAMIHKPAFLVSYMSTFTTLYPGDLILTGASGVTQAMKPGDVVEVEISGIGILRNPVEAERPLQN